MDETPVLVRADEEYQRRANPQGEFGLIDFVALLWRRKISIVIITVLAAVASVLYALYLPNIYTASSTVMPITSGKSSTMSQYYALAAASGISLPGVGESTPMQKIVAILKSRQLAERIIVDLDLVKTLVPDPESIVRPRTPMGKALEVFFKEVFEVVADFNTGIIKISATTKRPSLSRDIAERAVGLLEDSLNAKALTVSRKTTMLLETRVAEQEKKVRGLQDQLTGYQRQTGILTPQGQVERTMALYSSLVQQKIAAEIELSRLENSLSSDNPKITVLKTQIAAVERQIASVFGSGSRDDGFSISETPGALVKYQNILQELEIATKIYGALATSLENQRLQENEDQLFVEVIDRAVAPEKKSGPSRAMICVIGTMAGSIMSMLMVFVIEGIQRILGDPEAIAKFRSSRKRRRRAVPAG